MMTFAFPGNDGLKSSISYSRQMIASEWAMADLEGAMTWLVDNSEMDARLKTNSRDFSESINRNLASGVLSARAYQEDGLGRTVQWLRQNQGREGWSEKLIVEVGESISSSEINSETPRLVNLAKSQTDREKIVSSILKSHIHNTTFAWQASPDDLRDLISSTRLSEEKSESLLAKVNAGKWPGVHLMKPE